MSMPYVTTLQYREIFWQNGSLLYGSDTAKQEFFMRLQLRLQSLHKHDFISNQLLFYCWLTQQHFNFSVSFSFKKICKWLFQEMVVESILPNQMKWSWYHSFQKTMFYLMKSKYAIYFNIKVTKIERSAFLGTPGIVIEVWFSHVYLVEGKYIYPSLKGKSRWFL